MSQGADAASRYADALVGAGRVAEAVPVLVDAVDEHPDRAELWGRLAAALLAVGRLPEAWDAAARTVELAPAEPEAHRTIGAVALAMEAWPQAETAFQHVLTLNPGDAAARAALTRIPGPRTPDAAAAPRSGRRRAAEPDGIHEATGGHRRAADADGPPAGWQQAVGPAAGRAAAGFQQAVDGARRWGEGAAPAFLQPGVRRGATRVAALPDAGGVFVLVLRVLWGFAIVAYLGLAYEESAPYTAAVVTLVAIVLGAFGYLRWQHDAMAYKAELRRLDRPTVALLATGSAGILAVVPASMLGALPAARVAAILAAAAIGTAALLAGRRRQAGAQPGSG